MPQYTCPLIPWMINYFVRIPWYALPCYINVILLCQNPLHACLPPWFHECYIIVSESPASMPASLVPWQIHYCVRIPCKYACLTGSMNVTLLCQNPLQAYLLPWFHECYIIVSESPASMPASPWFHECYIIVTESPASMPASINVTLLCQNPCKYACLPLVPWMLHNCVRIPCTHASPWFHECYIIVTESPARMPASLLPLMLHYCVRIPCKHACLTGSIMTGA